MFIKKDLRKLSEILYDSTLPLSPPLTHLTLSRRPAEFKTPSSQKGQPPIGSFQTVVKATNLPCLKNLVYLSVYDSEISVLKGIEKLGTCSPNLTELNLGNNPISSLPDGLSLLDGLKVVWLDDCLLSSFVNKKKNKTDKTKSLPEALLRISSLEAIHFNHNSNVTHITPYYPLASQIKHQPVYPNLTLLSLENNKLVSTSLHINIQHDLPKLTHLYLRQNYITTLHSTDSDFWNGPWSKTLKVLHLSSNKIKVLPFGIASLEVLEQLILNSNSITVLPSCFGDVDKLSKIKKIQLSNNSIAHVPNDVVDRYGSYNSKFGGLGLNQNENGCIVWLSGNPVKEEEGGASMRGEEDVEVEVAMTDFIDAAAAAAAASAGDDVTDMDIVVEKKKIDDKVKVSEDNNNDSGSEAEFDDDYENDGKTSSSKYNDLDKVSSGTLAYGSDDDDEDEDEDGKKGAAESDEEEDDDDEDDIVGVKRMVRGDKRRVVEEFEDDDDDDE